MHDVACVGHIDLGVSDRSSQEDPAHAETIRRVADAFNSTRLTHFGKGLFQKCLAVLH